ncbi:hypothetical protein BH23VER1_BH23VER1_37490 [soil metagenome]
MRSRRILNLIAVLSMTLVGACGGGASEDTTTTAVPESTTSTTATTVQPASTAPDDDGPDLGAVSPACLTATQDMSEAMDTFAEGMGGLMTGGLDPESLEQVAGQLEAAAEVAPDDIRDDFEVMAEELGGFYRVLADMDYQPGSVPTPEQAEELSQLGESMDQEALQAATDNISAWFEDNCGG